jgi:hypothetical protein
MNFCFLEVCHAKLLAIGVILNLEPKNIRRVWFAKNVRLSVLESLQPFNQQRSWVKHQQFPSSGTASRLNYCVIRLILKSLMYRCILDVQQNLLSFILGQLSNPMRRQSKQLHCLCQVCSLQSLLHLLLLPASIPQSMVHILDVRQTHIQSFCVYMCLTQPFSCAYDRLYCSSYRLPNHYLNVFCISRYATISTLLIGTFHQLCVKKAGDSRTRIISEAN